MEILKIIVKILLVIVGAVGAIITTIRRPEYLGEPKVLNVLSWVFVIMVGMKL